MSKERSLLPPWLQQYRERLEELNEHSSQLFKTAIDSINDLEKELTEQKKDDDKDKDYSLIYSIIYDDTSESENSD